jgi:hypothetical protein
MNGGLNNQPQHLNLSKVLRLIIERAKPNKNRPLNERRLFFDTSGGYAPYVLRINPV